MFSIKNLRYRDILNIPALTLDRPVHCITGASGSGKTTLLRHLNRLVEPDQGEIVYNGTPLSEWDPVALRREVVMLGQTPVLYDGDIADNLQMGLRLSQWPDAPQAALQEALGLVGLSQPLHGSCGKLSGGEKQRLCLARVLLMDARVYLLDEPSASLDREAERQIFTGFAAFMRGKNRQMILVSHSDQLIRMFPEGVVRLQKGARYEQ